MDVGRLEPAHDLAVLDAHVSTTEVLAIRHAATHGDSDGAVAIHLVCSCVPAERSFPKSVVRWSFSGDDECPGCAQHLLEEHNLAIEHCKTMAGK